MVHRRYRESDVLFLIGRDLLSENEDLPTAIYSRVSSHDQKQKGDLERQEALLLKYCVDKQYKVGYILSEVGSGMSDTRPKLHKLFRLAIDKKISRVLIEHRDRLCRFNFEVLKLFFASHGVRVEYVNETLPKTYEAELVEDMLSLMSSFSARLYGRRSAERRKKCN
jgi:putative resolvase